MNIFFGFLLLHIVDLFIVQTWFVPDEFWQSLEVAHNWVFGYGILTWEWQEQVRSILYPGLFSIIYKLLALVHIDTVFLLTNVPRLISSIIAAAADCFTVKFADQLYGTRIHQHVIICLGSCWLLHYCAPRTITAGPETALTAAALSLYPWGRQKASTSLAYLWCVGAGCTVRPTTAVFFVPLLCMHLWQSDRKSVLLAKMACVTVVVCCFVLTVDSLYYGHLTFTPWNFLHFNVFSGLAEHYGTHPWHWYVTSGLPSALGPHLLLVVLAVAANPTRHAGLGICCITTLVVYSVIGHKEIRLLLPLLPPLLVIAGDHLAQLERAYIKKTERAVPWSKRALVASWLTVPSAVLFLYFSVVHQRGPLQVMSELRADLQHHRQPMLLFLTPCHSTPLYSHLHVNVPVRLLTCEPNLQNLPHYQDEADRFFEAPEAWLGAHMPHTKREAAQLRPEALDSINNAAETARPDATEKNIIIINESAVSEFKSAVDGYNYEVMHPLEKYPTHIVMFDTLAEKLGRVLSKFGYQLCSNIFHSYIKEGHKGNYFYIYCLPAR